MITITKEAADKLKEFLVSRKVSENSQNLRIKVTGGGCSGYQLDLDFDETKPGDQVFENFGVKVICDPKSYLYLAGAEIDYVAELMGSGFVVKNPNAKGSCGCGSSFSA